MQRSPNTSAHTAHTAHTAHNKPFHATFETHARDSERWGSAMTEELTSDRVDEFLFREGMMIANYWIERTPRQ